MPKKFPLEEVIGRGGSEEERKRGLVSMRADKVIQLNTSAAELKNLRNPSRQPLPYCYRHHLY